MSPPQTRRHRPHCPLSGKGVRNSNKYCEYMVGSSSREHFVEMSVNPAHHDGSLNKGTKRPEIVDIKVFVAPPIAKQPLTKMLVVGLTGGIATGKSSVSALFKAHQVPIVDADVLARHVVLPGTTGLKKIVEYFGEEVLLPNGTLDRKKLGSIIFNDEVKRKKLNSIVHPAVRKAMLWKILDAWVSGEKYCIMDVPLLIEGGLWRWMGKVIVVHCPPDIQLERLMLRDKSTQEEATSRLNSQMPIDEKLVYADIVIDNSGTPEALKTRIDALVKQLDYEVGYWWLVGWIAPFLTLFTGISLLLWRWALNSSRQKARRKQIKVK